MASPPFPRFDPPGRGRRGPGGRIAYLLRQAQAAVRGAIDDALADLDVTLPQFSTLTLIGAYDRPSAADIARLSLLTPQTVNVAVRGLERRGLLARTAHPVHGRILCLELTEAGERLRAACRARVDRIEEEMVEGLSPAEERAVRRWLAAIAERYGGAR